AGTSRVRAVASKCGSVQCVFERAHELMCSFLRRKQIGFHQLARRWVELGEIVPVEFQTMVFALFERGHRGALAECLGAPLDQTREGAPRSGVLGSLASQPRDPFTQLADPL